MLSFKVHVIIGLCTLNSLIEMSQGKHRVERHHDGIDDWDYREHGPDTWSQTYPDCGLSSQSPIDINTQETDKQDLECRTGTGYNISRTGATLVNNGHTVELTLSKDEEPPYFEGADIGGKFCFKSIHFHWGMNDSYGSEHTFDGKRGVMEMHEFYEGCDEETNGKRVVAAVLFEVSGESNEKFEPITNALKDVIYKDSTTTITDSFYLMYLIPRDWYFQYNYMGSRTTPPCTEDVFRIVGKSMVSIGKKQLAQFRNLLTTSKNDAEQKPIAPNIRPTQPLNRRKIVEATRVCE